MKINLPKICQTNYWHSGVTEKWVEFRRLAEKGHV